jgi:hypothetical protein
MQLPPLSFQSSSAADGRQQASANSGDWTVNIGGGVPGWVWAALAVGALWWIAKKR